MAQRNEMRAMDFDFTSVIYQVIIEYYCKIRFHWRQEGTQSHMENIIIIIIIITTRKMGTEHLFLKKITIIQSPIALVSRELTETMPPNLWSPYEVLSLQVL